jgi:DNA-binding transcriptional ArsR family regulator
MTPLLNRRRPDDQIFSALSAEPRRLVLRVLRELGPQSRAGIEDALGVPQAMSHEAAGRHLNSLLASGLVVRFGGGAARVRYRRDDAALARALRRLGMSGARLVREEPRASAAPPRAANVL